MIRHSRLAARAALLVLAATMIVLGGCEGGVKDKAALAKAERTFDMTVQSYKSGQFMLDGAVLSPMDLGSHFDYLRDQGELPKRVLLAPSDDTKIHKVHIQSMAYLEQKYGVVAYYFEDGKLHRIEAVAAKGMHALKDNTGPKTRLPDRTSENSAKGTSEFPTGG